MEAYCPFDSSSIPAECSSAQNYSFNVGRPCILIKINRVSIEKAICVIHKKEITVKLTTGSKISNWACEKIYGWRPEPYEKRPANYPKDASFTPNAIQITCEGQVSDRTHFTTLAVNYNNT